MLNDLRAHYAVLSGNLLTTTTKSSSGGLEWWLVPAALQIGKADLELVFVLEAEIKQNSQSGDSGYISPPSITKDYSNLNLMGSFCIITHA